MKTHRSLVFFIKSIFIFFYVFFCLNLHGQQSVTGRITDKSDGTSIPNVSVFIANTTIGTTSDNAGKYSINVPIKGSFEIVISHVGYKSVFYKIDIPSPTHIIDIEMETYELQEVTVTASGNYTKKDVDFFWRILLGEKPSKRSLEILNPEKIYLFKSSYNILKVWGKEPIEIINHKMGYRIKYVLESFEHDYNNNITLFTGNTLFEELIPENSNRNSLWEKKRKEVYSVSMLRFFRALYKEQINEEGFVLTSMSGQIVNLENILQREEDKIIVNIKNPLYLMCYSKPVTARMLEKIYYFNSGTNAKKIAVLFPQQLTIYSDGTYSGILDIQEQVGSIFGLAAMVPVENKDFSSKNNETDLAKLNDGTTNQTLKEQEISLIYGKITADELNMTVYEQDTSAVAVVLYENGNLEYTYSQHLGFQIKQEIKKKVKILKQEGVQEGDIGIPYICATYFKEYISDIEAFAYNIENGKIIKTKLGKKYIFDEKINNQVRLLKFSIPNVKKGTVIEYKYTKTFDSSYGIPGWNIQGEIPVLNSYFEALIPEYFEYDYNTSKGYEIIKVNKTTKNQIFVVSNKDNQQLTVTSNSQLLKFSVQDIPSIKNEPFVWCLNDYISGVSFELKATKFPYDFYRPYSNSWEAFEKFLRDNTVFSKSLKISNPYKDEIKNSVTTITNEEDKIEKIYSIIKDKIRWNEKYSLMNCNPKEAVKFGVGNNGQINMVLISALKDANIFAYPVLINLRSEGRIRFPSLFGISTFLVCAETSDGKKFYMDGSAIYGGLNMLPPNLLVKNGYIFNEKRNNKWINFDNIDKNQKTVNQKFEINKEGLVVCERNTIYSNQFAYKFKKQYQSSEDSLKLMDKIQNEMKVIVTDFSVSGKENISKNVEEKIKFVFNDEYNDEYVYVNPFGIEYFENPFVQSERILPVEFDYPYSITVRTLFTVPDGYDIEEIPEEEYYELEDNRCYYDYVVIQNNNIIEINFKLEVNEIIFPQRDYDLISEFFGQVATKCSELIVLRKI